MVGEAPHHSLPWWSRSLTVVERFGIPTNPQPPRFLGSLHALLASDPGRSHSERVGSDARRALFRSKGARRLRTLQSQPCS